MKTRDADPRSMVRLNNEEVLGHKVSMQLMICAHIWAVQPQDQEGSWLGGEDNTVDLPEGRRSGFPDKAGKPSTV